MILLFRIIGGIIFLGVFVLLGIFIYPYYIKWNSRRTKKIFGDYEPPIYDQSEDLYDPITGEKINLTEEDKAAMNGE